MSKTRAALLGSLVAASLGLAPNASAQRSLFDQPVAQDPSPATPVQAPATPAQADAPAAPKPKPKPRKPRGPVPARALTINNASPNVLSGLEVSGDGKTASLSKPLAPKKKATLKLPVFKSCTVTVSATFEGQAAADASDLDICKEKAIRFTE